MALFRKSRPQNAPAVTHDRGPAGSRVLLELMQEMRGQRESFAIAQREAALERRSERRWKMAWQGVLFGIPALLGIAYFLFFLTTAGFKWGPWGDVVGIVRIEGAIGAKEQASADHIVPILKSAFGNPNVKAIALSIDSGGGAPVEAERINAAIRSLKASHPKPIFAVINNIGASAAYMVAAQADEVIAGKYSLVGSIGAVMESWRLDEAIAKFEVTQRTYASGRLKAFLNPFAPLTPEMDEKAQSLVSKMGSVFVADVTQQRGDKLAKGFDLGTGEIWSGQEAKDLGLVDQIATLDSYIQARWGLKKYELGPTSGAAAMFSSSLHSIVVAAVRQALAVEPQLR